MKIYVYAPRETVGLRALISQLGAKRLVHFDGMVFREKGKIVELEKDSVLFGWGHMLPKMEGVRVLNPFTTAVDDMALNVGSRKLLVNTEDINSLVLSRFDSLFTYHKALNQAQAMGMQAFAEKNQIVPCKDFPDYFWSVTKLLAQFRYHIVDGNILISGGAQPFMNDYKKKASTTCGELALKAMKRLQLDFGVVSFVVLSGKQVFLRKIITAPNLGEKEVQYWAEAIQGMCEKKEVKEE